MIAIGNRKGELRIEARGLPQQHVMTEIVISVCPVTSAQGQKFSVTLWERAVGQKQPGED